MTHFNSLKKKTNTSPYFFNIILIDILFLILFFFRNVRIDEVGALAVFTIVSITITLFNIVPIVFTSLICALLINFFFIPPYNALHIRTSEEALLFLMHFFIILINSVFAFKIEEEEEQKVIDKIEKEKTIALYNILLNSLSHELRTPIATIIGAVDTLKENQHPLSIEHQHELLTKIDTSIIRLNRQVENLLHMSRLETGALKLKLDWCDINELIFSSYIN